jgi:aspartate dehydrogenase
MKIKKVGIIGCGTIGADLAKKIAAKKFPALRLACVFDCDLPRARTVTKSLPGRVSVSRSAAELIGSVDIIIEAASSACAFEYAAAALRSGKDIIVMSVGGLLDDFTALAQCAEKSAGTLYVPSGAICGIDGMLAARESSITRVTLTTSKPVRGLLGAPYFAKKGIDLSRIKKETVVFEGTALQAIRYFPKNVNVAAILSLASLGIKKTRVRIVTSPDFTRNSHHICAEGSFGRLESRMDNVPSPTNPKTSYMAVLAAEALLRKITASIQIGT